MDKNLHEIEKLFLQELEGNEEFPSENVWDSIERKLDKGNVVSVKKKYNSLRKVVLLLVFFLTGLSFYLWKNHEINPVATHVDISGNNKKAKTEKKSFAVEPGTRSLQKQEDSFSPNESNTLKQLNNSVLANLQKQADSLSLKKAYYPKQFAKDDHKIINKAILNNNNYIPKTSSIPITSNNLLNASIKKNKLKFNNPGESNFAKGSNSDTSEFSSQEMGKLIKKVPTVLIEIKATNRIEEKNKYIVSLDNIEFDKRLPAKETGRRTNVRIVENNTVGLFDAKKSLQNISLCKINPLVRINKISVQNPVIKSANQSQFAITTFYSPEIVFHHFINKEPGNANINNFDVPESKSHSLTFGALIDYSMGKRWGLQSGITLARLDFELDYEIPETLYAQKDNSGSIQYKLVSPLGDAYVKPSFSNNPHIGDSIFSKSTKYNLQYLGIPLAVKYVLNKGKFTFNVLAGVSANFLTRGRLITELESGNDNESETVDKISGLKPFYIGGLAGIGLDYNIYKKIDISFSPAFRIALNPINTNVSLASFPNSAGVVLGLKMKL